LYIALALSYEFCIPFIIRIENTLCCNLPVFVNMVGENYVF